MIYFLKPRRTIKRVFIHCSATNLATHDDISVIRKWHTSPKPEGRGWNDVGYHGFIKSNGLYQQGRDVSLTPAAQLGNNLETIAICLHGLNKEDFTPAQFATLIDFCNYVNTIYHGTVTFHGHCEVSDKACPVFNYKDLLRLDEHGRMPESLHMDVPEKLQITDVSKLDVLMVGSHGFLVSEVQEILEIEKTGHFGTELYDSLVEFQLERNLVADGIIGPKTWQALKEQRYENKESSSINRR
jgi:N-acetylmuramoyl-L-alanine amidase